MIRIAFFDFGETLVHDGKPFSGVVEALRVIAIFQAADGNPLALGIVSDFYLPEPPPTEAKKAALEARYRDEVLAPSGLAEFFQPFETRITLSSRAGVFKPDRSVFELAVARSGTGATLAECLFVTEDVGHLDKCRVYGMLPIHFGPAVPGMAAFQDWADAPALINSLIAPGHLENQAAVTAATLARRDLFGFTPTGSSGRKVRGRATQLVQLDDARLGPLNGVYIEQPTDVTVEMGSDGRVTGVVASPPEPEEVADAVNFVCSLAKSGKVEAPGLKASLGTTHRVEQDAAGRKRLVRRRYRAV